MIKDPYIGMPITMGGRCDTVPSNPVKPPQNPNPSPNPEMPQWKTTYSAEKGLSRGTIFPELDLPFEGRTILSERSKGGRM